jgi:hypothetical protein
MKASSTYPFEKLRDKAWLKEMGHVSTLMDYSRFNYVVQPEDGIDPELLRPRIGPYDVFAVKWGYTPIPEAAGADAEKPVLDAWARAQDATPWLRFSTPRANGSDSGENTEAVGDADAVKATALGTKNLQRVLAMLPAAAAKAGDSDETLQHMYGAVWSQWSLELGHVAAIVGGYQTQNKHQGQAGEVYTPETRARQEEAVRFIGDNLFRTPKWILARPILDRMTPGEGARRLLSAQRRSLRILLQDRARTNRLQEHEALLGDKAYRLQDLLADLRAGVFSELSAPGARIDTYRRNLQRAFLEVMDDRLNQAAAPLPAVFGPGIPVIPDDARGAVTAELKAIQSLAAARAAAAGDKATRAHLEDLKAQIARILDPRLPHPPAPPQMPVRNALDCWPEYD